MSAAVAASPVSLIALLNSLLCPGVAVVSLVLCTLAYGEVFSGYYLALAVLVFLLSSQLLDDIDLFMPWSARQLARIARTVLTSWLGVVGIILVLGYTARMFEQFNRDAILTWIAVTPLLELLSIKLARMAVRRLLEKGVAMRTAIIVGANHMGRVFACRLSENPYLGVRVAGFFDDRAPDRVGVSSGLLGTLEDVPDFVRDGRIDCVYVSLPMTTQPRLIRLIGELRDTTASVYFLPDFFVFDLLQARFDQVGGMPVAAIRETPHYGVNAVLKRAMDLVLSAAFILAAAPAMLAIAVAVRIDTPGPALFRQRRYGIDGREIVVLKFRTMTVSEDGDRIVQARLHDPRVTRLGAFLRRTSLDELPQLFNVLAGSMSLVGPRPHAVAHNEQYRKLVPGYMLRHKVKPGITGWAQINGFRGETDSLAKMQKRVSLDLSYLDDWSPSFDLWILLRTIALIWKDRNAY